MSEGPYLFDVGVIALAHAGTPVSERPLSYVRRAIAGEIDAVVPNTSIVGAHHVLRNFYEFTNGEASKVLGRFLDARRIHWYDDVREGKVRAGLEIAGDANVDGWDGYYAAVARSEGVQTILTMDDNFDRVEGIFVELVLTQAEFAELNEYLKN